MTPEPSARRVQAAHALVQDLSAGDTSPALLTAAAGEASGRRSKVCRPIYDAGNRLLSQTISTPSTP